MTVAKGIASGLPLGAIVARANLMTWTPGAHASPCGGNPTACAAALVTIELLERELIDNAARMGAHLMARLRDWPALFPIVGDVRGLGLMLGIELVRDQQSKTKAPEPRDRVVDLAFERGLLILGAGDNSLRLCPALVITRDQCDFALDTLGRVSDGGHARGLKKPFRNRASRSARNLAIRGGAWHLTRRPGFSRRLRQVDGGRVYARPHLIPIGLMLADVLNMG